MGLVSEFKTWSLVHIMLGVTFICSGLIINLIQLILFIIIKPFNKHAYRELNYFLLYSSWSQMVFLAEWWSDTEVNVYTTPEEAVHFGKEHALLIMNHNSDIEWLMGCVVGERCNLLGNCRVYAKKVLKYLPIIGWSWALSDMIIVERNWSKDSKNLIHSLQKLYSYQQPVWILIFCEGTRFTKEKHEASLKFAKERGLPLLKHHLLPRTKGFVFSVKNLKGKFSALYDITIGFSPDYGEPSMKSLLCGKKTQANLYIRRIPLEDIPTNTDEECNNYLYRLYAEKDKILSEYLTSGKFPANQVKMERRPHSMINLLMWMSVILLPGFYYLYQIVLFGSYGVFIAVIAFTALCYLSVNKMMRFTVTSTGSSYGKVVDTSEKQGLVKAGNKED